MKPCVQTRSGAQKRTWYRRRPTASTPSSYLVSEDNPGMLKKKKKKSEGSILTRMSGTIPSNDYNYDTEPERQTSTRTQSASDPVMKKCRALSGF